MDLQPGPSAEIIPQSGTLIEITTYTLLVQPCLICPVGKFPRQSPPASGMNPLKSKNYMSSSFQHPNNNEQIKHEIPICYTSMCRVSFDFDIILSDGNIRWWFNK